MKSNATYRFIIGVDEAGYGPNLGPLVVAASAWSVASETPIDEITLRLQPQWNAKPISSHQEFLPLGDSKVIYQSGAGRRSLALGVLALMAIKRQFPQSLEQLMHHVLDPSESPSIPNWYSDQTSGETEFDTDEFVAAIRRGHEKLEEIGTQFCNFAADVVFEPRFNDAVVKLQSKGLLLSQTSLALVARQIAANQDLVQDERCLGIEVFCDKHGGRNRYLDLLVQHFPEQFFRVVKESTSESRYDAFGNPPITFHFSAKGDRFVATAAASMLAKWLRELWMARLNSFWAQRIPDLSPTAGYPVDAVRFATEVEATGKRIGLDRSQWWRSK